MSGKSEPTIPGISNVPQQARPTRPAAPPSVAPGTNSPSASSLRGAPPTSSTPGLSPTSTLATMKKYMAPVDPNNNPPPRPTVTSPPPRSVPSQANSNYSNHSSNYSGYSNSTPNRPQQQRSPPMKFTRAPLQTAGGQLLPNAPPPENAGEIQTCGICSTVQSLLGFGEREYAIGVVPRGYGLTVMSLAGCYSLLRWERNRLKAFGIARRKSLTLNNNMALWCPQSKNAEKAYTLARNDFPRTTMLTLIGGLGMPYAAAVGALFWCLGRVVDFHEAQENRIKGGPGAADTTEPVLCRFGKFLMICGICKFTFDFTRGKLDMILVN